MFFLPLNYISILNHGELAPVGMDDKQKGKEEYTYSFILWRMSSTVDPLYHFHPFMISNSKDFGGEIGFQSGL